MPVVDASPEHEVLGQEIAELISRHAPRITAVEVLAIAANMVGKLVAVQHPKVISTAEAMNVVMRNIELGCRQVVESGMLDDREKVVN